MQDQDAENFWGASSGSIQPLRKVAEIGSWEGLRRFSVSSESEP
jgi:hypothetical protein